LSQERRCRRDLIPAEKRNSWEEEEDSGSRRTVGGFAKSQCGTRRKGNFYQEFVKDGEVPGLCGGGALGRNGGNSGRNLRKGLEH